MNTPITYKSAGVDIDAGNDLVKKISPLAKATHRAGVMGGLGGFGGLFDLKPMGYTDPILVSGTDGVGTKLKIAIDTGIHHTVGIDLVAMCVNDILVQGALPLFFMDYFATSKLNVEQAQSVISGIADGCKQSDAALLGGETAEMPDFYPDGHYDLAGFCVGVTERDDMLPKLNKISSGDVMLGLPSSGFHSNGFSLVRKIIQTSGLSYSDIAPWSAKNMTVGESLLTPTKIYVDMLKPVLAKKYIHALCHITGGGLTENLPRILPDDLACAVDLKQLPLSDMFAWFKNQAHLNDAEMLKTFNCGVGMVMIISQDNVGAVQNMIPTAFILGHITKREHDAVTYTGTL